MLCLSVKQEHALSLKSFYPHHKLCRTDNYALRHYGTLSSKYIYQPGFCVRLGFIVITCAGIG